MKRTACTLLCLLLLAGCGGKEAVIPRAVHAEDPTTVIPDQIDGVWIELVEGTLTPLGLEYTVHNENKGRRLTFGESFCLQMEEDGNWYDLEWAAEEGPYFLLIGYELDGTQCTESSHTLNWTYAYGELSSGHYRMLKEMIWSGSVMYPVLSLEFEIEE